MPESILAPTSITRRRALRGLLGGAVAVAALAALACTPKTEVTVAAPQQTGITVTGSATVAVKPDIARLNIGVQTTEATVAGARNSAAEAMTKVQAALKQKGIADKDLQTQNLSITPQYANNPGGTGTPTIRGYQVSNQLQVTVRNLDSASEILDAAGGNAVRVNGISFTVDKPEQFLSQAREEAVKNARARAEVLAKAAGVTLGAARAISESTNGSVPPLARTANAGGVMDAATPLNPGEQTLQLTVSVLYDIQ